MAITTAKYEVKTTTVETVTGADVASSNVTRDQFNTVMTLSPTTTPPVTKHAAGTMTMASGVGTLNLAAVVNTPLSTVDFTGLKIQVFRLKADPDNFGSINVQDGASNGYGLSGTSWSITLEPGQEVTFFGNDLTPDVASGARTIDFAGDAGTGTGYNTDNVSYVISGG